MNLTNIRFSDKIKYPFFTKNERCYYLTFSKYFTVRFYSNDISCVLAEEDALVFTEEEFQITKEEFIEANKDLLQKTGLINLFGQQTIQPYNFSTVQERINQLLDRAKEKNAEIELLKNSIGIQTQEIENWKEKTEQLDRVLDCQIENKSIISKMESMAIEREKEHFKLRQSLESEIKDIKSLLKRYL